uniref:oleoyl-[acyl-carrier-protein] hydrolase n=1 Tax=Romanomermis culicivorax TaxID=13658 RepID=A0A915IQV4_ROMCU
MDVNSLRPDKACIRLNDVKDGSPLFCVHSIEGVGGTLVTLASKLKFPFYVFQCTQEAPVDSIESLASFYIEQMRAVQPQGPYRILGYSYGASVAFEMATHLQRDCRVIVQSVNDSTTWEVLNGRPTTATSNIVGNLILLDGSHRYMKIYRNAYRAAYGVDAANLLNDVLFESEALCGFTLRFAPKTDYKQFRARLVGAQTFDQRVNLVVEHLMATGLFKAQDTIIILRAVHKKAKCFDIYLLIDDESADLETYEPQRKFDGNVTLIRAEVGSAKEEDVGRDYGLSEVTTGTVDVHVVPGDHDTFIHGPSAQITADIIGKALTFQPQN